ncbi:DUF4873 domain-containing protein [Mycobacterium spongiae]|uniref:DUF4873 domain-containing protein n=2 Tax=Mycobacterium spongiae TaxID=886343 RepID=A0A975PZS0_9MYCO|nr:DUF4873 domain-containing protein [Mycobacterium spongiae]
MAAGISDFAIFDKTPAAPPRWPAPLAGRLRLGRNIVRSAFDDSTDTWTLRTDCGHDLRARVAIAAHSSVLVPWIPDFAGSADFQGESFHAAAWPADFDPTGKRVAIIGADAAAGYFVGQLVESARSVTLFAHAPRRVVTVVPSRMTRAKHWLQRHIRSPRPGPVLTGPAIEALTSSGIRTSDGLVHRTDTIIFGTGLAIADDVCDQTLIGTGGLPLRRAWRAGSEPYFGVAVHGFPNLFFVPGPDTVAQARYVTECVQLMKRTASTRIEVRRSSQQVFNERALTRSAQPRSVASVFSLSSGTAEDNEIYEGAATLTLAGTRHRVRVRLTGHLDPIDGNYHWQGMILDSLPKDARTHTGPTTLTVGEHTAPARVVERTPWGTHSVAGVGAPPYPARVGYPNLDRT